LAKQLAQLGAAGLAIGLDEAETWRVIRKVGWDSVPAVRCAVIDSLARQSESIPLAILEEETGLPDKTVRRVAEDVVALKLARRFKDSGKWYFEQTAIAGDYWASESFPEVSEGGQNGPEVQKRRSSASRFCPECDRPDWCAQHIECWQIATHESRERAANP
jgi:DNA-binding IclR family transcriptional regulator